MTFYDLVFRPVKGTPALRPKRLAAVMKDIPAWIKVPMMAGLCGWLLWKELQTPARAAKESKLVRGARNLTVAAMAGAAVQYAERPLASPLAAWVEKRGFGLLKMLRLPAWLEVPLAILALDYTLYWWHVLNHRAPFLWRFHQPHHTDRDMDASTALRFHFAEVALSSGWRAAQIVLIGVSPLSYSVWRTGLLLSIVFHHANVRLSDRAERALGRLLVTPRMHEIHHSNVRQETDSNWSSGFSLWDRLHGTLRLDVSSEQITIGVPAYSRVEDVALPEVLEMPFGAQRESWRLPEGRLLETRREEKEASGQA